MSLEKQKVPDPTVVKLIEEGFKKFYVVWGAKDNDPTLTTVWLTDKTHWKEDYLNSVTWHNQDYNGEQWCKDNGNCGFGVPYDMKFYTNYWLAYGAWLKRGKRK